VLSRGVNWR